MTIQHTSHISPEAYLEYEYQAKHRHEYIDGKIKPMSYTSEEHGLIVANLIRLLGNAFFKTDTRVYPSDRMLYVPACTRYYYPDVMIVSGASEFHTYKGKMKATLNPSVLIEVLSASTVKEDTLHKWKCYKQLPSLKEYFVVAQDAVAIQKFTFNEKDENWIVSDYDAENSSVPVLSKLVDIVNIYYQVVMPKGDNATDS